MRELRYVAQMVDRGVSYNVITSRANVFGAFPDDSGKQQAAPATGLPWHGDSGGPLFSLSGGIPVLVGIEVGPWGVGEYCHTKQTLGLCVSEYTAVGVKEVKSWIDATMATPFLPSAPLDFMVTQAANILHLSWKAPEYPEGITTTS